MSRKITEETLKIIQEVHQLFIEKGWKLSVAESCTGGLISHYLTWLPGASRFFDTGVVTYSFSSKEKVLGVSSETIASHGVVSRETAKEMAEKVRRLTKTDVGVSTTGNLGPSVLERKPKGLVYIAISTRQGVFTRECMFKGTRDRVKEKASLSALKFLAEVIGNA